MNNIKTNVMESLDLRISFDSAMLEDALKAGDLAASRMIAEVVNIGKEQRRKLALALDSKSGYPGLAAARKYAEDEPQQDVESLIAKGAAVMERTERLQVAEIPSSLERAHAMARLNEAKAVLTANHEYAELPFCGSINELSAGEKFKYDKEGDPRAKRSKP
jgi:hypothetical protein